VYLLFIHILLAMGRRAIWNFDTLTPNGDDIPNYPVSYVSVVPKAPVTPAKTFRRVLKA
jgi:hypothetical protein